MKKVIFTEKAPAAIGPYSQAIEANGMVFLSGQIPVDPATGEFVEGGITEQTTQVFENIKNVLAEAGLTTANIVKTTVFLADMSLFAEMNAVYAKYFDGECPARSAIAVKGLPKGQEILRPELHPRRQDPHARREDDRKGDEEPHRAVRTAVRSSGPRLIPIRMPLVASRCGYTPATVMPTSLLTIIEAACS